MKNSRLVYSTETGRVCPKCNQSKTRCTCKKGKPVKSAAPVPDDGTVRIRRETQGRKGKTVTAVYGLAGAGGDPDAMARTLKQRCGTGGAVKEGVIFIQGDHRQTLEAELVKQGFKVKLAGG